MRVFLCSVTVESDLVFLYRSDLTDLRIPFPYFKNIGLIALVRASVCLFVCVIKAFFMESVIC